MFWRASAATCTHSVPAGKALYAHFELAETYPKASVGFSIAALPAVDGANGVVSDMRSIVANYMADGFPEELVEAAKRTESGIGAVPPQLDFGSRRRLVAGARGRGTQLAR